MSKIDDVKTYIDQATWAVKENSNCGFSISGMQLYLAENAVKGYMLEEHYKGDIAKAYEDGFIHIHDLGMGNTLYCCGHDLEELLKEGFNGVMGKVSAVPPKHLRSALRQMENYLFSLQGEAAGAQAFNNVDTLLAPYIKLDNLTYEQVKQNVQEFVYSMNTATRVGFQTPFTNVTFDIKCPESFKKRTPIIKGRRVDFTYADCNKEIGMFTQAFFELMSKGDGNGQPFTFPIPTVNLHKDFVWDDEVAKTIFEATAKYGIANFQNFINSDMKPEDSYSMCCRLRLDKKQLIKNSGGIFGSGNKTGSIGVVTINLPRLAYEAKDIVSFYKSLAKNMDLARDSLEIKRKIITENLHKNLMPYLKRYIGGFDNFFSTIGLVGGNEMALNLIGEDVTKKEGKDLMNDVLLFMKSKIQEYQESTGNYYNLEQTPAESTCYKLAKKDKEVTKDKIITSGVEVPYYTNSSHLPVNNKLTLFKMLETQEGFNEHYNGGTACHIFLGQRVSDWINCMTLVKRIAERTTLPFFDLTPIFSICPVHGYISGEHPLCPLEHTEEQLNKYGVEV